MSAKGDEWPEYVEGHRGPNGGKMYMEPKWPGHVYHRYTRTDVSAAREAAARREGWNAAMEAAAKLAKKSGLTWEAVCMARNEGGVCPSACDMCLSAADADTSDHIAAAILAMKETDQ
jgi:hypothetical protein